MGRRPDTGKFEALILGETEDYLEQRNNVDLWRLSLDLNMEISIRTSVTVRKQRWYITPPSATNSL